MLTLTAPNNTQTHIKHREVLVLTPFCCSLASLCFSCLSLCTSKRDAAVILRQISAFAKYQRIRIHPILPNVIEIDPISNTTRIFSVLPSQLLLLVTQTPFFPFSKSSPGLVFLHATFQPRWNKLINNPTLSKNPAMIQRVDCSFLGIQRMRRSLSQKRFDFFPFWVMLFTTSPDSRDFWASFSLHSRRRRNSFS